MPRIALVLLILALAPRAGAADASKHAGAAGPGDQVDGLLGGFQLGGEHGPVHIDADQMEFDYKTKVLTYRGAVVVTQADTTLHSNTLTVILDSDNADKPREVVAEGKVQIDKGDRRATGGRAVFDNAARTVTLSEQAHLQDGPNQVAGDRVVVYLDEQRSVVEGGQERVRAVLYPNESKETPGATPPDEHEH